MDVKWFLIVVLIYISLISNVSSAYWLLGYLWKKCLQVLDHVKIRFCCWVLAILHIF